MTDIPQEAAQAIDNAATTAKTDAAHIEAVATADFEAFRTDVTADIAKVRAAASSPHGHMIMAALLIGFGWLLGHGGF